MIILSMIIAATIGLVFRLAWAKSMTNGVIYRIPLLWLTIIIGIAMAYSPKSVIFFIGLFLVDFLALFAKDNKEHEEKLKNFINLLIDKLPLEKKSYEEKF